MAAVLCTLELSTSAVEAAVAQPQSHTSSFANGGNYIWCDGLPRTQFVMPEEPTIERAREDEREGKAPSTQAGEFVREEMEHIREGEHGARSPQQAIAIGLSKARRAGVKLPPPKRGQAS